jgi:hypothetical protein
VDVVNGAPYCQYGNSILARDTAEIRMKPLPHFVPDGGSSLRGSKHHMHETTYVTMRHAFSRPFGTTRSRQPYPGLRPGLFSGRPFGTLPIASESTQDLTLLDYFQLLALARSSRFFQ